VNRLVFIDVFTSSNTHHFVIALFNTENLLRNENGDETIYGVVIS